MASSPTLATVAAEKEKLSGSPLRIRRILYQLVSEAQSLLERTEDAGELSAALNSLLDECDTALGLLGLNQVQHFSPAWSAELKGQIDSCAARLAPLSEQLEKIAAGGPNAQLRSRAARIHELSASLGDSLPELEPESTPAARESEPGNQERSRAASSAGVESKPLPQSGMVLVVDDNEGNRDLLARRLLRDGCEVMLAEAGRQALRMARRYEFDLVLLDIMMPGMDGFAVLAELKRDPDLRHLPVIMISAVDEIDSVVRCIELGAEDYLFKPFNPVLLRARIHALLEKKQLRDEEVRRTRELEQALAEADRERKKAQQLLLNILPASVAEELQANGHIEPMYFEDVTIVFADFVGFTLAVEQLPAEDLVGILNEYFTAFDNIVGRYALEKLKTIGDSYMFAGGIPVRNPSHPVDAVLAALEMIHLTEEKAAQGPARWQLRIGVHTGPVVAGVVGIHKFAFDIWGDAVNFSSRMESSSAPGKINMSAFTYARVKDFFACQKRGQIEIKHGREVDMYFVNGISPSLLEAGETGGTSRFGKRYRTYFRNELRAFPDFLQGVAR